MFKLISIMIRLAMLAAVLVSMQKATMCLQPLKTNVQSMAGEKSGMMARENIGATCLLSGRGIDLQGFSTLTAVPKLMNMLNGEHASASESAATQPARPSGHMTIIRYSETDAKRNKKDGATVTKLPSDANATMVDGRLQVFYPAGKK